MMAVRHGTPVAAAMWTAPRSRHSFRLRAVLSTLSPAATAAAPSPSSSSSGRALGGNPIVRENSLPGSPPAEWDVNGCGDPTIQGFATAMSVLPGETIGFKVDTDAPRYRLDIYRLGYYQGLGARHMATVQPFVALPQVQPPPIVDIRTGLVDCGNWDLSAKWAVPAEAVSGLYIARLVRPEPPTKWRADNSQAAGSAWMTGAPSTDKQDDFGRLPSHPIDDEAVPQPQPHAYGANGLLKPRSPIKEPRASHIYFVVRQPPPSSEQEADSGSAEVVVHTADTTWQAYNSYGGTCLYGSFGSRWDSPPKPRSYVASYNRPLVTRDYRAINAPFGAEYPLIRFLERSGYFVAYQAHVDTHRDGVPAGCKLFISSGHDEYWTGAARVNVEAARDERGVHLAFFSGNEVYWRCRFEPSAAGAAIRSEGRGGGGMLGDGGSRVGKEEGDCRTMVCWKDSLSERKLDPTAGDWTGAFRDSRPINPLGAQPENSLTGQLYISDTWANYPVVVPRQLAAHRFWRHTAVAAAGKEGRDTVLLKGLIGHEFDTDVVNGFRPAGLVKLSSTTLDNVVVLQDFASTFDSGSVTHSLVLYRQQQSGALVFGAGTCQWAWGLDNMHDTPAGVPPHVANAYVTRVGTDLSAPDVQVQQATTNLFADMGVLPATPIAGLVVDPPAPGRLERLPTPLSEVASVRLAAHGQAVEVRGVLTRLAVAGRVAGIEVSLAGGVWHPATIGEDGCEWEAVVPLVGSSGTLATPTVQDVRSRVIDDLGWIE